ncbi:MAG: MFS transporter [Actinomycetota bacterium]|nr:MFS transporter [Actinomycetota bacterium]
MNTFRSLQVRNYRLFAVGQVVSLSGTWGQRVAQAWLVLELSDNSGVALGIATALQFLPVLLFGLYGGVLADRSDKRRLLIGAQAAMAVLALLLAMLDLSGVVALWHVFVLAFGLGLVSAVDTPARQSFIVEMVGPDDLPNAISLNSATFNSARIIGPALAGVAIAAVGTGWVFLANAMSYAAVLAGLRAMRASDLHCSTRLVRAKGQLREGLVFVRSRPDLLVPMALVFMVGTFGLNFQITLALVVKEVFGRGAGAYGLLTSIFAVGSLLGALLSARRAGPPRQRTLFIAVLAFGLLEVLVGFAPTYALMALLLLPTGIAVLTFTTTANAIVQLGTTAQMRGRVMALYILVFMGGTPVGAPLIGSLAQAFGPRSSIVVGGAVTALSGLVAAAVMIRLRALRLEPHLVRRRPHIHVRQLAHPARLAAPPQQGGQEPQRRGEQAEGRGQDHRRTAGHQQVRDQQQHRGQGKTQQAQAADGKPVGDPDDPRLLTLGEQQPVIGDRRDQHDEGRSRQQQR